MTRDGIMARKQKLNMFSMKCLRSMADITRREREELERNNTSESGCENRACMHSIQECSGIVWSYDKNV